MATHQGVINLTSSQNEILLNPRWPREDFEKLFSLATQVQEEKKKKKNLQGHVWIATSGSTAENISSTKLVALAKKALLNSAEAVNRHLQSDSSDVWTQVLPPFHVGGLGIEVRSSLVGARVIPALKDNRWDVHHFYEILKKEKVHFVGFSSYASL